MGFDEFVVARSPRLVRLAYLLTRDHGQAEDLVQTALARSWSAWRRIDDDPEPYVRRVLLNTYNSWWRRRWHAERPTAMLPERVLASPQAAVDERDEVWRALDRLPRQQRAVLVLRYFEDLSEVQIAEALGVSAGAVKGYAAKGLAKLRVDPSLVAMPDAEPPVGVERLAGVHDRIRQRRRNRLAVVGAAGAVVVAVLLGYLLVPGSRNDSLPPALPTPTPTVTSGPTTAFGTPEFYEGYRRVGGVAGRIEDRTASFVWTPTTVDAVLLPKCTSETPGVVGYLDATVNGERTGGVSCENRDTSSFANTISLGQRYKLRVGVPVTVVVTVSGFDGGPTPTAGRFLMEVGEAVSFADYPFPARPSELKALPVPAPDAQVLSGTGPRTVTFRWPAKQEPKLVAAPLVGWSQTPGRLRITFNGVEHSMAWWAYDGGARSIHLSSAKTPTVGQEVTVTVEPENFTGEWYLAIMNT
ncbi:SigE family RNA polymerase sigma factor [Longispora urticae]